MKDTEEKVLSSIRSLEECIQRDEGKRGLRALLQTGESELLQSAKTLASKNSIAILTGFPCLVDHSPPTETDGPLGSVALAELLLKLGKKVYILTDECNEEPLLSCVAQSGIWSTSSSVGLEQQLHLESFPDRLSFDEKDAERLSDILDVIDCVVAIERVGPSADGNCYTMRGVSMNHLAAPLELLLITPPDPSPQELMNNTSSDMPASVRALESCDQGKGKDTKRKELSEEESKKLLEALKSDIVLSDEQFEAMALLSTTLPIEPEKSEEIVKEKYTHSNSNAETLFSMDYDYSESSKMSMADLMAELPPPPTKPLTNEPELAETLNRFGKIDYEFNSQIASIGIGDGGNELGMGKIISLIKSSDIPNGDVIACTVPTDHLIVSSVSNWGAYALVAAVVVLLVHREGEVGQFTSSECRLSAEQELSAYEKIEVVKIVDRIGANGVPLATSILSSKILNQECSTLKEKELYIRSKYLPSKEQQIRACEGLISAGGRDGITKECALSVDGMPLEKSLSVLEELNNIAICSLEE